LCEEIPSEAAASVAISPPVRRNKAINAIYRTEPAPTICYSLIMSRKIDSAGTVDKNGKLSNTVLHEQMTQGVDDYDFRMQTRAKLLAAGVPVAALDSVLSEKPRT
jgi:hypothetical protein